VLWELFAARRKLSPYCRELKCARVPRMRFRCFLIALCAAALLSCLAPSQTHSADKPSASAPIVLAPHQALYKITMTRNRSGTGLSAASGTVTFGLRDLCDGWTMEQNMRLRLSYAEGDDTEITSPTLTWEAKNGSALSFHVRRLTRDVGDEEDAGFDGRVKRDADGSGVAHYTSPMDKKDIMVTGSMIFPVAHTILTIQKAQAGEKMFAQTVFDGAEEEGFVDISTFIGAEAGPVAPTDPAARAFSSAAPLMTPQAWPVRQAFFKPDKDDAPDYEMSFILQPNGVVRGLEIDYGDFVLHGALTEIKPLPTHACPQRNEAAP